MFASSRKAALALFFMLLPSLAAATQPRHYSPASADYEPFPLTQTVYLPQQS